MKIFLGVSLVLISLAAILYSRQSEPSSVISLESESTINIQTPKGSIKAIIADTEVARQHGLSDRIDLPLDHGMLFVFPNLSKQGFWMKDMHFPLDIVWIDEQKEIIGIDRDISPETFPNVFFPSKQIKYVLELNAGQAKAFGLEIGIKVDFKLY